MEQKSTGQTKVISTKRGNVSYTVTGETNDECLFFCHGLTADHTMFWQQTEYFGQTYKVICMDTPLHGDSRPYRHFSYDHVAEDMQKILRQEKVKHAVFAGQSLGGYNCQVFYLKYPQMVDGFISIDSTPMGDRYTTKADRFWLRHAKGAAMCYPRNLMIRACAAASCYTKDAEAWFVKELKQYTKKELNNMYGECYRAFLEYHDSIALHCPVLLLLGENDKVGKVRQYNEMWAKDLNTPIHWIHDAGHNANCDNPKELNCIIDEFLQNIKKQPNRFSTNV